LRHFFKPDPDLHFRAAMKNARAKTRKSDSSAASTALIALARLLAQQASREWANANQGADLRSTASAGEERQK
jgi:hypothetical protein